MSYVWGFHKNKDIIRSFVLPDKPIVNGIWLPGDKCLCVKKAEKAGLLNAARSIILVERDHLTFEEMKLNAPNLSAVQVVEGELEDLRFEHSIDYAYLDFFGGLAKPVTTWMSDVLSPHIARDATIAITQIYANRGSKLLPAQEWLLYEEEGREIRNRYGIMDVHTQQRLLLLHRIFTKWDFDIETDDKGEIPIYRDLTHKMMVLKMVNFRKAGFVFRSLQSASRSSEPLARTSSCR